MILRHGTNCAFHAFDTFGGMPNDLTEDEAGFLNTFSDTSFEDVRALVANNANSFVHQGIFPDCADEAVRSMTFRFAHIDVDIERSVLDCCAFVYLVWRRAGR